MSPTVRAVWAPSLARRVLRNRVVQAVAVVAVGVACAVLLTTRAAALDEARASWGATEPVVVLTEHVAPGDSVADAVEIQLIPGAMIPPGAVTQVLSEGRAKVPLFPGEILLGERVTESDESPLPAGTVALTLPVLAQVPLLDRGDLVDVWVVDSANFSSQRVAANVTVLAFSDRDITVAVPHEHVATATVASLRPVTITLVG